MARLPPDYTYCFPDLHTGAYAVLHSISIYLLLRRRKQCTVNHSMILLCIGNTLFCLCTIHVVVDLIRAFRAFVGSSDLGLVGALAYYEAIWDSLSVLRECLYATGK